MGKTRWGLAILIALGLMVRVVALRTLHSGDEKSGIYMACRSDQTHGFMPAGGMEQVCVTPLNDLAVYYNVKYFISYADCHEAETMDSHISCPAFREAMEMRGVDLATARQQEMRTCARALGHVEYYFGGEGEYLIFPWTDGAKIESFESGCDVWAMPVGSVKRPRLVW